MKISSISTVRTLGLCALATSALLAADTADQKKSTAVALPTTTTVISPTKTAYVRLDKVMPRDNFDSGAHEWRDGVKKITDYASNESAKIKADHERWLKLKENFEKSQKMMDDDALQKKARELEDLQNKIKRDSNDVQQVMANQEQALQRKMLARAEKVANDFFIKKQGWDAVFIGAALAISDRIDITDEMMAVMNKEYDAEKTKTPAIASKPAPAVAKK
jgi:Skp family chaperone for outer membrane proteins